MLFRCMIRGENFLRELDGEKQLLGFFTQRLVEARDEEEAESLALQALRADPALAGSPEHRNEQAMVYFEEIRPLTESDTSANDTGFVWFPMEE